MARLDRLGPAREVAQVGAVIGRDFSYTLLSAVAGLEDAPLQTALERLAEADILLVQGLPPESDYRFKHALIQDAAYENLLKSRRQLLHRRVGEVLRDQLAAGADDRTGVAGASLHAGGSNRSCDRMVGQSGTAVVGALGPAGGGDTTHPCTQTRSRRWLRHLRCVVGRSKLQVALDQFTHAC